MAFPESGRPHEGRGRLSRHHQSARPRQRRKARARARRKAPRCVHQHPVAVPLRLSMEGQDRGRRGIPDAHQDHEQPLRRAGSGDPLRPSLRTSGNHRGPIDGGIARVPRLGRFGNATRLDLMHRLALIALLLLSALPPARAANADDLLEPDKAFRFSVRVLDAATVEVHYAIADGYYLYRERFRFAAEPASVTLGRPLFPQGQIHEDKFFGKQEIYRKEVRIRLPFEAAGAERFKLVLTAQGCADLGVCYVPQVQSADLRLASLGGPRSSTFKENEPFASSPERVIAASDDVRVAVVLESGRLWRVMAVFFGAGLLLTVTPCVLPMIPILSGIIVGEGRKVTRGRAAL